MNANDSALAGLKVIDCATYVAGPAAATVMSDFGADVIKIERPPDGDFWRTFPSVAGYPNSEFSYTWMLTSRNKRSIALDLSQSAGRDALLRLVTGADGTPAGARPAMGDHPTAMTLFAAIMLGLYRRERSGLGSKVSTSLMAAGAWANSVDIQAKLCGARFPQRKPGERPINPLIAAYPSSDGHAMIIVLLDPERECESARSSGCVQTSSTASIFGSAFNPRGTRDNRQTSSRGRLRLGFG
jgi:crotonobetainyl-CoA:carnitine CoA-transferase CaiB-like acyl-CoA transferase